MIGVILVIQLAVQGDITGYIESYLTDFSECPESQLPQRNGESDAHLHERRHQQFKYNQDAARGQFVNEVFDQWICACPKCPSKFTIYVNTASAMTSIRKKWTIWYENHQFYEYLRRIVHSLEQCAVVPVEIPNTSIGAKLEMHNTCPKPFLDENDMFAHSIPSLPEMVVADPSVMQTVAHRGGPTVHRVTGLLQRLRAMTASRHASEQEYVDYLERSA